MRSKQLFIFILLAVLLSDCSTSISSGHRSILKVVAINAFELPTVRSRTSFNFKIIAIEKLSAGLYKSWNVGDTIGFTMYQGADYLNGKDAIGRLLDFLHARANKSTNPNIALIYSFEETQPLLLEVIHTDNISDRKHYPGMGLWTLTNADGNSVSVNTVNLM